MSQLPTIEPKETSFLTNLLTYTPEDSNHMKYQIWDPNDPRNVKGTVKCLYTFESQQCPYNDKNLPCEITTNTVGGQVFLDAGIALKFLKKMQANADARYEIVTTKKYVKAGRVACTYALSG